MSLKRKASTQGIPLTPYKQPLRRQNAIVEAPLVKTLPDQDDIDLRETVEIPALLREGQREITKEEQDMLIQRLGFPADKRIIVCTSHSEKNNGREYFFVCGEPGFQGWVDEPRRYYKPKKQEAPEQDKNFVLLSSISARLQVVEAQLSDLCFRLG